MKANVRALALFSFFQRIIVWNEEDLIQVCLDTVMVPKLALVNKPMILMYSIEDRVFPLLDFPYLSYLFLIK